MKLRDDRRKVWITLSVLEARSLEKTKDILSLVGKLPCNAKELAATTAAGLAELLTMLAKPVPADTDSEEKKDGGWCGE